MTVPVRKLKSYTVKYTRIYGGSSIQKELLVGADTITDAIVIATSHFAKSHGTYEITAVYNISESMVVEDVTPKKDWVVERLRDRD